MPSLPCLPLWNQCAQCGHLPQCTNPFAPDGVCPHPAEAASTPPQDHPVLHAFEFNVPDDDGNAGQGEQGASETASDTANATRLTTLTSLGERARRGLPWYDTDFVYLRQQALPAIKTIKQPHTGDGPGLSTYDLERLPGNFAATLPLQLLR